MMKMSIFSFLFSLAVLAASPIPLNLISGGSMRSPIDSLKAISKNSQYQTCKDDLSKFVSSLSPADEKEIASLREKFDAKKLKALMTSKKREFPTAAQDVSLNLNMKSGHFLIVHGRLKCQISIYTEIDSDGIKSNVDPTSDEVKIYDGLLIDATLVGASADATATADVHMDPSKVLTILKVKLDVTNQKEQIKLLEELHEAEAQTTTIPRPSTKPVK